MGKVQGVSEIAFWVEDVEKAIEFYQSRFDFQIESHEPGQHAFLSSGDFLLVLFNPNDPGTSLAHEYLARVGTPQGGLYHVAFRVNRSEIDAMAQDLREKGTAVKGPIDFGSGRRSYFFGDLDHHYIELTDR